MGDPMGNAEAPASWEFAVAPPRSAPGVASMVGYRALDVPDTPHLGLPSASLTFIVSLDDGVEAAETAEALADARPNPVVLGGLHVAASHVRQRPGQAGVQLAVHPLASRALFGVPSAELSVRDFDGLTVLGARAAELRERVAEATGWREAFGLVADHLVDARRHRADRRSAAVRPELAHAWHLLERSRGRSPVGAVAERVGLSARHLTTLFRREVGRSPKTVARLMRFEHTTARIAGTARRGERTDLAAVAAACGYSDQPHLTHEFVRFTGLPPRAWLAREFRNLQDGGFGDWSEWAHDTHAPQDRSDRDDPHHVSDPGRLADPAGG
ncbi:helix-turn-helix domain-containing protein [Streptomyces sp. B6B3]|uniref:AraC family transcriptional regulator n=1 Tax=Streptomyces sp. B6B3 TaxID=3153570 RepID=UPI00325DCB0F